MVWFEKTRTDLLLACDAPGCKSVLTLDDSSTYQMSEYARAQNWNIDGKDFCPDHADRARMSATLGGRNAETRRKEILNTHPLAKEYTG